MKILMVLTSHDQLGDTGKKTGFWLEEFAAPYYVFKDAGAEVTLASPKGGQPPLDPDSDAEDAQTEATVASRTTSGAGGSGQHRISCRPSTPTASTPSSIPGVTARCGTWPRMPTASADRDLRSQRPSVGAVCHAPAVFKHPKAADGKPLVSGRTVTGFTNTEEEGVGLTDVVPFLVEDMLIACGGHYQKGDDWASFVVTDGKLVTGQNPASSEDAARKLLDLL